MDQQMKRCNNVLLLLLARTLAEMANLLAI